MKGAQVKDRGVFSNFQNYLTQPIRKVSKNIFKKIKKNKISLTHIIEFTIKARTTTPIDNNEEINKPPFK